MNKGSLVYVYCIQAFEKSVKCFKKWNEGSVISTKMIVKKYKQVE